MAADWNAIKTEYITTDTSYRKLAQKYGVHYNVIANRSKQEGWISQRNQHRDKTVTKAINVISDKQVDRVTKLIEASDLLLCKVVELLEDNEGLPINSQSMKHISGVLRDVKEIQMIKSEAANVIEVVFAAGPEEWNE